MDDIIDTTPQLTRYEAYSKAEELRRERLVDEAMVQDY